MSTVTTTGKKSESISSNGLYPTTTAFDLMPNKSQYYNKDGSVDFNKFFESLPLPAHEHGSIQAIRVPNSKTDGFSSIYRNSHTPNALVAQVHPELNTAFTIFEKACELYSDLELFGVRKFNKETGKFDDFYTYETYKQIKIRRNNLGSGFINLVPDQEKFVISLFSPNRPEWLITQEAASAYSLPFTALYDTLGPNTAEYILNFTKSPILLCPIDKIIGVLKIASNNKLLHLKYIISMDDLEFDKHFGIIQLGKSLGITIMSIKQLEKIGSENPIPFRPPSPDDLFGISFTSGTTGNPKGVKLSHANLAAGVGSTLMLVTKASDTLKEGEQPQSYCFLPLAHIYELLTSNLALSRGTKIAFPHNPNPIYLVENLKIAKPHFCSLVPRVYNKFEFALKQGLNSSAKGRFVLKLLLNDNTPDLVRKTLQKKTRALLGFDRVDFVVSGSAPINPATIIFLKKVLGIKFKQGYGLTESFAGTSSASYKDKDVGSSGPITVSTEMKLRDVPDMGYLTTDDQGNELDEPRGELLLRGPQIFEGYYKNQKATDEVRTSDGWFSTGDVVHVDKQGRITIIDRVKNFFKLSQGEYVSPEKIEGFYMSECAFLTQMFVTGMSVERYLVGIVGVDPTALRKVFHKLNSLSDDELLEKINGDSNLKKQLLHKMNSTIKELQGFEKIHNLVLSIEPLKLEDNTITPTMKIKRSIAHKFFLKQIEDMYKEGDLVRGDKI